MKAVFIVASFAALAAAVPKPDGVPTIVTKTLRTTTKPSSTSCTLTICADYINSCGQMYGGCYPACSGIPRPTFTAPPCPSTKSTTTTTKPKTTTRTKISECPRIICVDKVNSCGLKYGGCYDTCGPVPTFSVPPCPTKTTTTPTPTATPHYCGGLAGFQCPKGEICIDDPKSPCGIASDCLGICIVGQFCGGIAAFQCPKGEVCIDDPRDDCSPETGGADCGGLCVPSAFV
jgi:hypothetical protein